MKMDIPNIHFVDMDRAFIDAVKKKFSGVQNVAFSVDKLQQVPLDNKAFLSPVNNFGDIDYLYSRKMFPGIEQRIQEKIATLGYRVPSLVNPYLPVGSAIIVVARPSTSLIVTPYDASKTHHTYRAFNTALCMLQKYADWYGTLQTLVCPALGYENVETSATNVYQAYSDYVNDIVPSEDSHYKNIPHAFVPCGEKIPL